MEIFQELTFTAFLALIFSFVLAKVVYFVVPDSGSDDIAVGCTVTEGVVAKEGSLNRGLRVKGTKGRKRVKFVNNVEIKRIDRAESENASKNLELLDDSESVGGLIIEKRSIGEKTIKRIDQFGDKRSIEDSEVKSSKKQSLDVRGINDADIQDEVSENIRLLMIEKKCSGRIVNGVFGEKEKILVTSWQKSQNVEEEKNEVVLEYDDMIIDKKDENGAVDSEENEGLSREDAVEEGKARDKSFVEEEEDEWEGIERSELDKVFAEAINFVEYGRKGKLKDNDRLAKLDSTVQMQLYGLHKVAMEGPCHKVQPLALMVSSRAKWNAWQRLGRMSQKEAMEQYIKILSDSIPEWMYNYSADYGTHGSSKFVTSGDSGFLLPYVPESERKLELTTTDTGDSSYSSSHVEKDKE